MKLFITSNQQFGRHGAIEQYARKFGSVEQMDEYMIQQWNSVVSEGDLVYVVGNFAWDPETAEYAIKRLNGTIIVMDGKWDRATKELVNKLGSEIGVAYTDEGVRYVESVNVCLSYWPLSDWPHKDEGAISVVGLPKAQFNTNHSIKRVNVAVDYWDFKPVDIKKVIQLFSDPDLA
jgi:calcineurin-like phosphoesterase family protein